MPGAAVVQGRLGMDLALVPPTRSKSLDRMGLTKELYNWPVVDGLLLLWTVKET